MKPGRTLLSVVPVTSALRSCAAFISVVSHFRFALVPVHVHRLVSPCAPVGQFVQSCRRLVVVEGTTQEPRRAKGLTLSVGQDRRAASEWMPCGIRREVRGGGYLA